MKTNKNFQGSIKKSQIFLLLCPFLHDSNMSGHACSTINDSDRYLPTPRKIKSDTDLFQRYLRSINTQIYHWQVYPKLILCLFHCLSTCRKWKSDADPFKRYWGLKNTQICSTESIPGAGLLQANILCLFISLMSFYLQNIKARHQSFQKILRIKRYSNQIGWEHARGKTAPN